MAGPKVTITGDDKTASAFDSVKKRIDELNGVATKTGRALAALQNPARLLGGVGLAMVAKQVVDMADSYSSVNSQLKNALGGISNLATAQQGLFGIAQRTRQSYTELAASFAQISASAGAALGTQADQLRMFETISQAIAMSGASADSAAAALMQFRQGLAAGALRGEELNSVMEQTPALARAIAEGLGVGIGRLREMGQAGELTTERLRDALEKVAPSVARQFANVEPTFNQAMTNMVNSIGRVVSKTNAATGATSMLARIVQGISRAADRSIGVDRTEIEKQQSTVDILAKKLQDLQKQAETTSVAPGRLAAAADLLASAQARLNDLTRTAVQTGDEEGRAADLERQRVAAEQTTAAWAALSEKYQSTKDRLQAVIAEIRRVGAEAGKSSKEIEALVKEARSRVKTPEKKDEFEEAVKRRVAAATELQKKADEYAETLRRIDEQFFAENPTLNLDQYQAALDAASRVTATVGKDGVAEIERLRKKWLDAIDPIQKYRRELEEVRGLVGKPGGLSSAEAFDAEFDIQNRMQDELDALAPTIKFVQRRAQELEATFTSAFENAALSGQSLREIVNGLAADMGKIFLRNSITQPLGRALGSMFTDLDIFGLNKLFPSGGFAPRVLEPAGVALPIRTASVSPVSITQSYTFNGTPNQAEARAIVEASRQSTLDALREANWRNDRGVLGY